MSDEPAPREVDAGDPTTIAAELAERFRSETGKLPDGVWMAPGRVNIIGEHTDYNRGRCLPIALPHATYVAMRRRADGGITASSDHVGERYEGSTDKLGPGRVDGWAAYVAGVIWAARRAGIDAPGVDIVVTSTVPVGAGLSSSAALECAVAIGVCELAGLAVDRAQRRRLVDICVAAERDVAGAPTGGMDQTVSLLADSGHALLIDFDDMSTAGIRWQPELDGIELLVVDTGIRHSLSDGGYADRRRACELAARRLDVPSLRQVDAAALARLNDPRLRRRARHVITEIERVELATVAIRRRNWQQLGRVFGASHASLRDDFEVSCDELDVACQVAVRHGALGARMTGGGFGGSAVALVPKELTRAVSAGVSSEFDRHGWCRPTFLVGSASSGARVVPAHGP